MKFNKRTIDPFSIHHYRDEFLAGDENAYSFIYQLYSEDLYAYGKSICTNTELIEDAIHDIFVDIYTNRHRLKKVENIKFYLLSAFRNRLFFLIKNESVNIDLDGAEMHGFVERDVQELWIDKEIEDEKTSLSKRLLSELNLNQREVLYHRFVEELSCDEIAVVMNINYQSVKNLLYRTIKKLKSIASFTYLIIFILLFLFSN